MTKTAAQTTGWKPGDDVCVIFDDKTGENRSLTAIQALIDDLTETANRHDFDLRQFGTSAGFAQFFHRAYKANGKLRGL